jgi:hypothetical protein
MAEELANILTLATEVTLISTNGIVKAMKVTARAEFDWPVVGSSFQQTIDRSS